MNSVKLVSGLKAQWKPINYRGLMMINSIFGFAQTPRFKQALEKTAQKFENMPAEDVFALARKHSNGDIALFLKATQTDKE